MGRFTNNRRSDYDTIPSISASEQKGTGGSGRQYISLSWRDISLQASSKHEDDVVDILNKVSGYCPPGKLLAIMGPSGAGLLLRISHKQLIY